MPTLASTSRAILSYIQEAVFGTTPSTGYAALLRMTGESLAHTIGKAESEEIRSDRVKQDVVSVSASAGGGVNMELSYREYDPLIEAMLQGTWLGGNDTTVATCTITLGNTITASAGTPFLNIPVGALVRFSGFANAANNLPLTVLTASGTVITLAGTPLTNEVGSGVTFHSYGKQTMSCTTTLGTTLTAATGAPFANVVAGQWIRVAGMTTPANNKVVQVVSKTSSTVLVFAASTFTNEVSAGASTTARRVTNGTTQRSFSIERQFADIAQFFTFRGMNVQKMSLSLKSGSIVSGSFDFVGKDGVRAATTGLPASPLESQTYKAMNAVSGVGTIYEGGAALTGTYIKSLTLEGENNLRPQDAIGTLGPVGMGNGQADFGGTLEVYLADGSLYDKFIDNTASSLSFSAQDALLNGYVFTLPNIKYKDAKVNAGARNQDAMLSMPFEALYDTVSGKAMIVDAV